MAAAPGEALVLVEEVAAPVDASSVPWTLSADGDALVGSARDLRTNEPRTIRITADGASVLAGGDVLELAPCAGGWWTVTLASEPGGTRYAVRDPAGVEAWSHLVPNTVLADVALRCVVGVPTVAWTDAGELAVRNLRGDGPTTRTRLWPPGTMGRASVAAAGDALIVAAVPYAPTGARLMRLVGGAVTHTVDLGRTGQVTLGADERAVVLAFDTAPVSLRAWSSSDLAPGPVVTIPPSEPGHRSFVRSLVSGPGGRVAVVVDESWIGDDFVAIPQGEAPDRYEPVEEGSSSLRLFSPATGALGPATPIDRRFGGPGGWLGDRFVLLLPVEADREVVGAVRMRPAVIRRYRVAPRPG